MWLSARDTYNWAHKAGASWPCSTLGDKRLVVVVDRNGLCDLTVDGRGDTGEIDGQELDACISDHCPKAVQHLWPRWAGAAVVKGAGANQVQSL
jgi:hypothetical protein